MKLSLWIVIALGAWVPRAAGGEDLVPDEELYEGRWVIVDCDPSEAGECLLCGSGVDVEQGGVVLWHRGRKVRVCANGACHEHWLAQHDAVFRQLQPKAGLWDEPVREKIALSRLYMFLGVWILAGLLTGAGCAYMAIGRGQPPTTWFLIGLGVNVIGLVLLLTRPRLEDLSPEGVPKGLRKVPATRTPVPCPGCGVTNHPSASECPSCGGALTPSAACEVERA